LAANASESWRTLHKQPNLRINALKNISVSIPSKKIIENVSF